MRGYLQLAVSLLKSQLREPVGFFFTIVFSPALVVILGLIFGNEGSPEFGGAGFVDQVLPGFSAVAIAIVGVMLVPQAQLLLRTSGALTRLRVTPLRPVTFVAADLTVNFLLGLLGAVLALTVGVVVFGVDLPANSFGVLAALVIGLLAFLAIGYTLAAVYPSVGAAVGIGNVLMILMMLTSGAFIPTAVLPSGVQAVMEYSPVFHVVELVQASWAGEPWPWVSAVAISGVIVVFGALGVALFRWHRT